MMDAVYRELLGEITRISKAGGERDGKLKTVCELICGKLSHYHWAGFYLVDPERKDELILGPFCGEDTEHKRIRFGSGICGQAADLKKTFMIPDVTKEVNYLSCSISVRSEIVVPVFNNEIFVAEIDIDSHFPDAFSETDRDFLEQAAAVIGESLF